MAATAGRIQMIRSVRLLRTTTAKSPHFLAAQARPTDPLANGIAAAEHVLRERLVHDQHPSAQPFVFDRREIATGDDRCAECPQARGTSANDQHLTAGCHSQGYPSRGIAV
jgi:hypothetical protein